LKSHTEEVEMGVTGCLVGVAFLLSYLKLHGKIVMAPKLLAKKDVSELKKHS